MVQSAQQDASRARFHARLRWVGAPLLLSGVVLLCWGIASVMGGGSAAMVFVCLFGTGLGLASFGANHDTALALALRAREASGAEPVLVEALSAELDEELEQDRGEVLGLRPSPRIAMVIPLVALVVQGFVLWRLSGGGL